MKEWHLQAIGAVLFFMLLGGVGIGLSYMEARTFNKLSGRTDVTWWDAMWVKLRVDCVPKESR